MVSGYHTTGTGSRTLVRTKVKTAGVLRCHETPSCL